MCAGAQSECAFACTFDGYHIAPVAALVPIGSGLFIGYKRWQCSRPGRNGASDPLRDHAHETPSDLTVCRNLVDVAPMDFPGGRRTRPCRYNSEPGPGRAHGSRPETGDETRRSTEVARETATDRLETRRQLVECTLARHAAVDVLLGLSIPGQPAG